MLIWFILILMTLFFSNVNRPSIYKPSWGLIFLLSITLCIVLANQIELIAFISLCVLIYFVSSNRSSTHTLVIYLKSIYLFLFSMSFIITVFECITLSNVSLILSHHDLLFVLIAGSALMLQWIFEYHIRSILDEEKWKYLFETMSTKLIIMVFILLLTKKIVFLFILLYTKHSYEITMTLVLALLLELFFDFSFIQLVSKSYDLSLFKHEHKILTLQYEIQASYYEQLESYQVNLRKIAHDIHHHKLVLHHYLKQQKYEEATLYLDDYALLIEQQQLNQLCANPMLNALLLKKQQQCLSYQIDFNYEVELPSDLSISDFNLCILLGNLLDNALESCSKHHPSFIRFTAKEINHYYTFKIENTCSTPPVVKQNKFKTQKAEKLFHGLGLLNVERVVSEHNGMINFNSENSMFTVLVAIPV